MKKAPTKKAPAERPALVDNGDGTRTCPIHDFVVYPDELGCGECWGGGL